MDTVVRGAIATTTNPADGAEEILKSQNFRIELHREGGGLDGHSRERRHRYYLAGLLLEILKLQNLRIELHRVGGGLDGHSREGCHRYYHQSSRWCRGDSAVAEPLHRIAQIGWWLGRTQS